MNNEKKITQAIIDAKQIYEDNYKWGNGERIGYYQKTFKECCKIACENNGLHSNLANILSFACANSQDIKEWAKKVTLKLSYKELPCCNSPSKEKCEQCQETGIANPLNQY